MRARRMRCLFRCLLFLSVVVIVPLGADAQTPPERVIELKQDLETLESFGFSGAVLSAGVLETGAEHSV